MYKIKKVIYVLICSILFLVLGCKNAEEAESLKMEYYKVLTVLRKPVVNNNQRSSNAEKITPVTSTVIKENIGDSTFLYFYAKIKYAGTDTDPNYLSDTKARFYFIKDGDIIYDSNYNDTDGFYYARATYTSYDKNWEKNPTYTYDNDKLQKGDIAYINTMISITEYDHPLKDFNYNDVDTVLFDFEANIYEHENISFIDDISGVSVTSKELDSSKAVVTLTNLSSDTIYTVSRFYAYNTYIYLEDANGNIVYGDEPSGVTGYNSTIKPGKICKRELEIPLGLRSIVKSFTYINDYEYSVENLY